MVKFYDTNALLLLLEEAFEDYFLCSDITLREIESIKTSSKKDEDVKYRARKLIKLFDQTDRYSVVNYTEEMESQLYQMYLDYESPDNRIGKIMM